MHIEPDQARALLAATLAPPEPERRPLRLARGLRLAADLPALVGHPSATESALDGIACRAEETLDASAAQPHILKLIGESRAGEAFTGKVGPGEAVRIYTGAPLPQGTNAICPVEQLQFIDPDQVQLLRPARPEDVRVLGSDFQRGEVVLRSGTRLTPARLALAAALGYAEVPVRRPWRVALLSTGDEVIEPGQPLCPGQVYDSNRVGLQALLEECSCEVQVLGHAPDDLSELRARLDALGSIDLLLTSGGVSMGRYDFLRDLLLEQGEVLFWKIRMRPGGPALLGRWQGLPVFGLPGNPVSSLLVFQLIVRPVLSGQALHPVRLRAATPFKSAPDRTVFARARLGNGEVHAYAQQGSGILRSLSESDALVIVPPGKDLAMGDDVEVLPNIG